MMRQILVWLVNVVQVCFGIIAVLTAIAIGISSFWFLHDWVEIQLEEMKIRAEVRQRCIKSPLRCYPPPPLEMWKPQS